MRRTLIALLCLSALAATGCRRGHDHDHAHAGHDHGAAAHVHTAPHGGVLLELGNHAHNLELVSRPGGFDLYVLDAHATNFVRIAAPALPASAVAGGRIIPLAFVAQANPATGERIGQTSHFAAEWSEAGPPDELRIAMVEVQGAIYRDLTLKPVPMTQAESSSAAR